MLYYCKGNVWQVARYSEGRMRDYATARAISDQGEGDAKMHSNNAASREVRGIQNRRFLVCENYLDIGREEKKQGCV
jgi:hypothetical protein